MKIFHEENGRQVVYVQLNDIAYLTQYFDAPVPVSIYQKVYGNQDIIIIDNTNRWNFVRFDGEHEIEFFEEVTYIPDFEKYNCFTATALEQEHNRAVKEFEHIREEYAQKQKEKHPSEQELNEMVETLNGLLFMVQSIAVLEEVKRGIISMPFPDFVTVLIDGTTAVVKKNEEVEEHAYLEEVRKKAKKHWWQRKS